MDAELASELGALSKLSRKRLVHVLQSDSPRYYELTKALVDVLYNICVVQSVEIAEAQKRDFEAFVEPIRQLLSRKVSLAAKKALLLANVPLVVALSEACLQQLD